MKHLLVLCMILFLGTFAFGQGVNQNGIVFLATVGTDAALEVSEAEVSWSDLVPGTSYKCIADIENINNIVPWNEVTAFAPGEITITGSPGAQVVITFILPTSMYATAGVGSIALDYDNQSANWFDGNAGVSNFFNPLSPFTITINADGEALILMGGNPTVSTETTAGSEFQAYGITVVEYTGGLF